MIQKIINMNEQIREYSQQIQEKDKAILSCENQIENNQILIDQMTKEYLEKLNVCIIILIRFREEKL